MRVDISFLPALAVTFLLIFARIGVMVMLLPGFGEMNVPRRVRLGIALVLTAILFPLHRSGYQLNLGDLKPVLVLMFQELLVGAVLGITARLTMSALQVAGSVVAQQLGLGFVTAVDPTQGQQGMLIGNFLTLVALALFFALDLHHLVIAALNDSFRLFRPGEIPDVGDAASLVTRTIGSAFRLGLQLSAPLLVFGLVFNLALGVLARLMPQMQVYFVATPLTIMIGLVILILIINGMMTTFMGHLEGVLRQLAPYS
jgi:flagellar biosynthesis protein FliR